MDGYCFIKEECWAAMENKEDDIQQVCIPQNNTLQWTFVAIVVPKMTEPCSIFKDIPDLQKRETSNKPFTNDIQIGDVDLEEGWYGEDSYDMLRAPASSDGGCGSLHPVWLQGNVPTEEGNITYGSGCVMGLNEGCVNDIPIEIKRCNSTFNVYYLKPTEVVFSSYCFSIYEITTESPTTESQTSIQLIESTSTTEKPSSTRMTTQNVTTSSVTTARSTTLSTRITKTPSLTSTRTQDVTSSYITKQESTTESTSTAETQSSTTTTAQDLTSSSAAKSVSTTESASTSAIPSSSGTTAHDLTSSSVTKVEGTTESTNTTKDLTSSSVAMFESTTLSLDIKTTTISSLGSYTDREPKGDLFWVIGVVVGLVVIIAAIVILIVFRRRVVYYYVTTRHHIDIKDGKSKEGEPENTI